MVPCILLLLVLGLLMLDTGKTKYYVQFQLSKVLVWETMILCELFLFFVYVHVMYS